MMDVSKNALDPSWRISVHFYALLLIGLQSTQTKQEEASTHKSAKTHAGNVFVTRDLDLRPLNHKISGFSELIVEHLCVTFGNDSCIGF